VDDVGHSGEVTVLMPVISMFFSGTPFNGSCRFPYTEITKNKVDVLVFLSGSRFDSDYFLFQDHTSESDIAAASLKRYLVAVRRA